MIVKRLMRTGHTLLTSIASAGGLGGKDSKGQGSGQLMLDKAGISARWRVEEPGVVTELDPATKVTTTTQRWHFYSKYTQTPGGGLPSVIIQVREDNRAVLRFEMDSDGRGPGFESRDFLTIKYSGDGWKGVEPKGVDNKEITGTSDRAFIELVAQYLKEADKLFVESKLQ